MQKKDHDKLSLSFRNISKWGYLRWRQIKDGRHDRHNGWNKKEVKMDDSIDHERNLSEMK